LFKVDKLSPKAINNLTYDDSPNFSGIVAGECKGDMWVDDLDNPNIALVYSFAADSFSILGEPSNIQIYNKFKDFLLESMFDQLKSKGIDYFEFSVESEKAKPYILDIFNNRDIQNEDEYILRKNDKYNGNIMVPDGYEIFKVDYECLKKLESGLFENKDFLLERLLESWGTYDNFLNKSIGYVAVNQNRIVAVILGTARFKNIIPIDIETENSHRKKGLALALTRYFVNECIDKGVVVQWDCMDSNIASRKTAERVGFQLFRKNKVYWFDI
jgi:hypothetical protein